MADGFSSTDLKKIINSEHSNPHSILGMHRTNLGGEKAIAIRAFVPQADSMAVSSTDGTNIYCEMKKVDDNGFFEAIINNRDDFFKYELIAKDISGNEWKFIDPYCFDSLISEYDVYLFNKGKNYRVYEKLGSHPMIVNGVSGVLFGVWAPNAKRVSVIGDFNLWDGRRNQMRLIGTSGVWELFIPGLMDNDLYKYEIKTEKDALIQKSDPYGNFMELRPNTASKIFDINTYRWSDQNWIAKRRRTNFNHIPMSIYEVHLGSWLKPDDKEFGFLNYKELAHRLVDYVKDMGYTHIELMPVEEHPFDGSWGYQVTGYYAPSSRYGNPYDFMYFVDYCHQNEIGIILDWVPAHFPRDMYGLAKFDGTPLYEYPDPRKGEHPDWGTLIFNYAKSEVKNFLIANAVYWLEKYHIDGLRVDAVASMLYLDYGKKDGQWVANKYGGNQNLEAVEFMQQLNNTIDDLDLGALMIAEESTAWDGVSRSAKDGGLGYNFKWNMGWMNDFINYMSMDPIYRQFHQGQLTFSFEYMYSENYILVLSHDEVVHGKCSMINKMPGEIQTKFSNLRAAYGFMYAHPGKKLSFMGNEFAQLREWSEERSLDWDLLNDDNHKKLHNYCRDLNSLYKKEKCLWELDNNKEGFECLDKLDGNHSFVAFSRQAKNKKDKLIFLFNFIPVTYKRVLGVDDEGEYVEIFNSDASKYGGTNTLNLKPLKTDKTPSNGKKISIALDLPGLSMIVLRFVKR